jgi:hypothetical protein
MQRFWVLAVAGCGRIGFGLDGTGDGGTGDGSNDAGLPARCSSMAMLADDFVGNQIADERWAGRYAAPAMSLVQAGGNARIQLVSQTDPAFAAFQTGRTYDLRDSQLTTQITSVPRAALGTQMFFEVQRGDQRRVEIAVLDGMLTMRRIDGIDVVETPRIPFVLPEHRYWRLAGDATGKIHGGYSSTGDNFTELGAFDPPFDPQYTIATLAAGSYLQVGSPGIASWATVNNGAAVGEACAAGSFADNFDDAAVAPFWQAPTGGGQCTETGGELVAAPADGAGGCELQSGPLLDLRDDAVSIEVLEVTNPAASTAVTELSIGPSAQDRYRFRKTGTNLVFQRVVGDNVTGESTAIYDPTAHLVWRIRGTETEVIGETSPDGQTFTELGRFPGVADRIYVAFGAGNAGSPAPGVARFDDYNVP